MEKIWLETSLNHFEEVAVDVDKTLMLSGHCPRCKRCSYLIPVEAEELAGEMLCWYGIGVVRIKNERLCSGCKTTEEDKALGREPILTNYHDIAENGVKYRYLNPEPVAQLSAPQPAKKLAKKLRRPVQLTLF